MLNRRDALGLIPAAAISGVALWAAPVGTLTSGPRLRPPQGSGLPLVTTGLEHLSMTCPNPRETAHFWGRIFNPQLFGERDDPDRNYCTLGTAYMAFGMGTDRPPFIDHFCALIPDYNGQATRQAIEQAGISMTPGGFGMVLDPDEIRFQMLNVPGGLAGTIAPAGRISLDPPAVHAIGIDHLTLRVSNLAASVDHYTRMFGAPVVRQDTPRRVWFQLADTRLGLEPVPEGGEPGVDHFCLRVAGFDRLGIGHRLQALGATLIAPNDEGLVRFQDLHGITVELMPV